MLRKINILFITIITCSLFSMDWLISYKDGIIQGAEQEKPVLFLFVSPDQKESLELSYLISKGYLDFLEDKFIMVQLNIIEEENLNILNSLKIDQTPVFLLQDYDPERKLSVKMQFMQPQHLFNALFDIYSKIGNQFIDLGDIQAARNAFDLISGIPNEMGVQAKSAVNQIDQMQNTGKSTINKKDKIKTAQSYFDQASFSIKNGNFDKAYLYLQKVIDTAPKSDIAKKAELEQEKISDKVDKSKFLKKKDTKGHE